MTSVTLRVVSEADLDLVHGWENNPEFWAISANTGPFTKSEVLEFIRDSSNLKTQGQCRFIISTEEDGDVGALDLFDLDEVNKTAGLGILIAEPKHRRKKLAGSALRDVLQREDIKRSIRLVWCLVHTDNLPSQRLFESCGFVINGKKLYKGKEALRYIYYL